MPTRKSYSHAARAQGILRIVGFNQGITIGKLEEFGATHHHGKAATAIRFHYLSSTPSIPYLLVKAPVRCDEGAS